MMSALGVKSQLNYDVGMTHNHALPIKYTSNYYTITFSDRDKKENNNNNN